jgi:hypothetical protein
VVGGAWLWSLATPVGVEWRFLLVFFGLLAVAAALSAGLRPISRLAEARLAQVGMVLLAALTAFLGGQALLPSWDSVAMLLSVASGFGLLCAILLVLPWRIRAVAISLLAVVHLFGIFNAILFVPPMDSSPPWMTQTAFMYLYRPWQQMTNLTNGYHFYAPEPGPVVLVYFRVEYADGTARWVRIPDHKKGLTGLATRRFGALASSLGQTMSVPPERMQDLLDRRRKAGEEHNPPLPMDPFLPPALQYREPGVQARMQIASYVRYVARTTPHPTDPDQAVTGVKVYRVDFHNPRADLFPQYKAPEQVFDPVLYWWFYLGEHTPDGELKPSSLRIEYNAEGWERGRVQDPFLYWMLPVFRRVPPGESQEKVFHSARAHAGDKETESNP